jgi:type I restriction enzyme S subunit
VSEPKTNALPAGWAIAMLGDICDPPQYGWTTSATDASNAVKLLRSTDISRGTINWESVPFCETPPPAIEKYQLHPGDIVITRTGVGVGNSLLLDDCPPSVFASYLIRFRPHTALSAKYVAYFLKSSSYKTLISQHAAGIAQPNVNAKKLASLELPIAPRKAQEAVVAEIEKQFTRLDAAVVALKRVQANLKRYRTVVLKAAFEGRLVPTEAELCRHEQGSFETASKLLERNLTERLSRWQAAQTNGRKTRYKDGPDLDTSILPALPEGWEWASLGAIAELKGGLTKGQKRKAADILREVPYLRVANVQRGFLALGEVKTIDATEEEIQELRLETGDVLFNEGGDRDKLGRGWVWEGKIAECVHQNHVFRAR